MSYERLNIVDGIDKWNVAKVRYLEDAIIANEAAIQSGNNVSIQANWIQNDETAPDFIKNKTHYVEFTLGDTILSETTGYLNKFNGHENYAEDEDCPDDPYWWNIGQGQDEGTEWFELENYEYEQLEIGTPIVITIDGVSYFSTVTRSESASHSRQWACFIDHPFVDIVEGYFDDELMCPVIILSHWGKYRDVAEEEAGIEQIPYTIKIEKCIPQYHPLDINYLPEEVAIISSDFIATLSNQLNGGHIETFDELLSQMIHYISNSVNIYQQNFLESEKARARANIDAVGLEPVIEMQNTQVLLCEDKFREIWDDEPCEVTFDPTEERFIAECEYIIVYNGKEYVCSCTIDDEGIVSIQSDDCPISYYGKMGFEGSFFGGNKGEQLTVYRSGSSPVIVGYAIPEENLPKRAARTTSTVLKDVDETPTAEQYNALLQVLRDSGILATE